MFCSTCGKQVVANAAFCSGCGSRVGAQQVPGFQQTAFITPAQDTYPPQQAAYQQPQPVFSPVPSAEETLLVLKVTHKLSLANAVVCHVVFKRNWLVLAHLTTNLQKFETARLMESMKAQNLGMIKRTGAQMRFWGDFYKRYYSMTTEAILAEDMTNKAINYGMITLFDYVNGYTTSDDESSYDHEGKLHLSLASSETLKFTHQGRHDKDIYNLLTGLFGGRLRYKK